MRSKRIFIRSQFSIFDRALLSLVAIFLLWITTLSASLTYSELYLNPSRISNPNSNCRSAFYNTKDQSSLYEDCIFRQSAECNSNYEIQKSEEFDRFQLHRNYSTSLVKLLESISVNCSQTLFVIRNIMTAWNAVNPSSISMADFQTNRLFLPTSFNLPSQTLSNSRLSDSVVSLSASRTKMQSVLSSKNQVLAHSLQLGHNQTESVRKIGAQGIQTVWEGVVSEASLAFNSSQSLVQGQKNCTLQQGLPAGSTPTSFHATSSPLPSSPCNASLPMGLSAGFTSLASQYLQSSLETEWEIQALIQSASSFQTNYQAYTSSVSRALGRARSLYSVVTAAGGIIQWIQAYILPYVPSSLLPHSINLCGLTDPDICSFDPSEWFEPNPPALALPGLSPLPPIPTGVARSLEGEGFSVPPTHVQGNPASLPPTTPLSASLSTLQQSFFSRSEHLRSQSLSRLSTAPSPSPLPLSALSPTSSPSLSEENVTLLALQNAVNSLQSLLSPTPAPLPVSAIPPHSFSLDLPPLSFGLRSPPLASFSPRSPGGLSLKGWEWAEKLFAWSGEMGAVLGQVFSQGMSIWEWLDLAFRVTQTLHLISRMWRKSGLDEEDVDPVSLPDPLSIDPPFLVTGDKPSSESPDDLEERGLEERESNEIDSNGFLFFGSEGEMGDGKKQRRNILRSCCSSLFSVLKSFVSFLRRLLRPPPSLYLYFSFLILILALLVSALLASFVSELRVYSRACVLHPPSSLGFDQSPLLTPLSSSLLSMAAVAGSLSGDGWGSRSSQIYAQRSTSDCSDLSPPSKAQSQQLRERISLSNRSLSELKNFSSHLLPSLYSFDSLLIQACTNPPSPSPSVSISSPSSSDPKTEKVTQYTCPFPLSSSPPLTVPVFSSSLCPSLLSDTGVDAVQWDAFFGTLSPSTSLSPDLPLSYPLPLPLPRSLPLPQDWFDCGNLPPCQLTCEGVSSSLLLPQFSLCGCSAEGKGLGVAGQAIAGLLMFFLLNLSRLMFVRSLFLLCPSPLPPAEKENETKRDLEEERGEEERGEEVVLYRYQGTCDSKGRLVLPLPPNPPPSSSSFIPLSFSLPLVSLFKKKEEGFKEKGRDIEGGREAEDSKEDDLERGDGEEQKEGEGEDVDCSDGRSSHFLSPLALHSSLLRTALALSHSSRRRKGVVYLFLSLVLNLPWVLLLVALQASLTPAQYPY